MLQKRKEASKASSKKSKTRDNDATPLDVRPHSKGDTLKKLGKKFKKAFSKTKREVDTDDRHLDTRIVSNKFSCRRRIALRKAPLSPNRMGKPSKD